MFITNSHLSKFTMWVLALVALFGASLAVTNTAKADVNNNGQSTVTSLSTSNVQSTINENEQQNDQIHTNSTSQKYEPVKEDQLSTSVTNNTEQKPRAPTNSDEGQQGRMPSESKITASRGSKVDVNVTNAKVSTKEISGGGTTQFSFDFSVPNSAKSGDSTIISLPDELNFTRNQSFNVYAPDGVTIVTNAVIDKDAKTLTMTYTDYVDTHDDVSGHINMQVMADTEKVKKNIVLPATILVNEKTITVDSNGIKYEIGKGDADIDFWKYGWIDYDKNEINYEIRINTSNSSRANVVIKDILHSAGMSYEQGSITIATGTWGKDSHNNWSMSNYKDVTNKYTPVFDGSSFSVNLGNITQGFSISYKVKPSYKLVNGEQIKNSSSYSFSNQKTIEYNNIVYYQETNGTANGYNYSLQIQKTDESGNPLAGATFKVVRQSTGKIMGTITTDSTGKGTIYGLLRDNYELKETSAPEGYQLADTVVVTPKDFNSQGVTAKVVDKLAKTSVSGTKTWNDNNNQDGIRPGAITVNLLADGTQVASKTVTASDNWKYSFDNLPEYANGKKITYTVSEAAVDGYTTKISGYDIINTHIPVIPETPQTPNGGNQNTPKYVQENNVNNDTKDTNRLPQTGNASSVEMIVLGLLALLVTFSLAFMVLHY